MKDTIDDGGPAFPQTLAYSPEGIAHTASEYFAGTEGMSLRAWLAGQSLGVASQLEHDHPTGSEGQATYAGIARRACLLADFLLRELEGKA